MDIKYFPDQRDGEKIEEYAKRTWGADAQLQDEFFDDFEAYVSYCTAMAAGRVKSISRNL